MGKISVVINTINEEKNLPKTLASVKDFAGEIIVVDMHSDDDTVKIAKKFGARLYKHKRTNYVEPARNFAISKAKGDWILILDADETLTKILSKRLKKIVDDSQADYYRLPRKNIIFGKWIKHSRWWPDYNIRFFKKGFVEWSEIIHSVPTTQGRGLDLPADEENAIVHYHYYSIEQYIERMNRYTGLHAENKVEEGYKFNWSDLIKKPSNEFLSRYYQGEGYKDGVHGLALAGLQSFSEMVLYLKIWQLKKFKSSEFSLKKSVELMKDNEDDHHYWQADALLKISGSVGKIKHKVKRKLKLR